MSSTMMLVPNASQDDPGRPYPGEPAGAARAPIAAVMAVVGSPLLLLLVCEEGLGGRSRRGRGRGVACGYVPACARDALSRRRRLR